MKWFVTGERKSREKKGKDVGMERRRNTGKKRRNRREERGIRKRRDLERWWTEDEGEEGEEMGGLIGTEGSGEDGRRRGIW